jgi:serine/threonine-protein kinase RsbW
MTDQAAIPDDASHVTDLELRCPPNHSILSLVRRFISNVAFEMGFDTEEVSKIEISVDEACANVIDHAYEELRDTPSDQRPSRLEGDDPHPVMCVKISIQNVGLTIQVSDRGQAKPDAYAKKEFSFDEYAAADRPRGLGIHIIKNFMDEVDVQFPEGKGTTLIMTKFLDSSPADPNPTTT